MKKTWKIMLCVLLTIAILGGVWMLSARVTSAQIYAALEELPVTNKTSEISAYLDRYFIDDYDEDTLADGAASGMVDATGDEWSYYLSADEVAAYEESMANAYVGVGITITEDAEAGGMRVEEVVSGGPAEEAGIPPCCGSYRKRCRNAGCRSRRSWATTATATAGTSSTPTAQ